MNPVYTTKDGLIYLDGAAVMLPDADTIAQQDGYKHAEQMVKALEEMKRAAKEDPRGGLPSASSFERIVFCPGSVAAAKACPPETEENEIASRGSLIHEALATGDDTPLKLTDKKVTDRLRKIEEEAIEAWMAGNCLTRAEVTVIRETRLWIRRRGNLQQVASAQVDCAAIAEKHGLAIIIDAKSGFLDVTPAEINWQLRVQAVALWHEYNFKIDKIVAAISSGRVTEKYDPVAYDSKHLMWAEQEILFFTRLAEDEYSPRVPGPHCRYCPARGSCAQAVSFAMIPVIRTNSTLADRKTIELKVALLEPAALAAIHTQAPLIESILEGVKSRLKGMLKDDLAAIGLELKPNAPMRKITDVQLAYEALSERKLITDQEFRAVCKLPIGTLEELIIPKIRERLSIERSGAKVTVEEAEGEFERIIARTIEMQPKAPSLKPLKPKK